MIIKKLKINGCYLIECLKKKDIRGFFCKQLELGRLEKKIKNKIVFKEYFVSSSKQNCIRGMHFQKKPYENYKLVTCLDGSITDVIFDRRKSSSTYGKYQKISLNNLSKSIFVDKGVAHGFLTLSKSSLVSYLVTSDYKKSYDTGIKWNSIKVNWGIKNPIISNRDKKLKNFVK